MVVTVGDPECLALHLDLFLSILVFYTFMDYSILGMTWNTFVTLFFVGNLTLYFAVRMRSGLGAGMVTGLVLFLHLISAGIFDYAETRYFIFFNPYDIPDQMDPRLWDIWMIQNRLGVFGLGLVMIFFALRGMENRDRLLR